MFHVVFPFQHVLHVTVEDYWMLKFFDCFACFVY